MTNGDFIENGAFVLVERETDGKNERFEDA